MVERSKSPPPWLFLESNQEQAFEALESLPLLVLDATARIVFANVSTAGLLQRPLAEVLGAHFLEFMDEEGRERARAYLETASFHPQARPELKFKRSDGEDAWVVVHRKPLQSDGQRGCVLMILTDVSRLKSAERDAAAQCRQLLIENQRLSELATLDPLTGLLNRRALDERLVQETARARRHNHPLSLLLLDVDRFKALNDTLGHVAGDAALREVALALQLHVRLSDIVARFGGEEFVVIAPHTPPAGATVLGERLRGAIEQINAVGTVTVSVGIAQLDASLDTAGNVAGNTGMALLARADRALYRAKREGRNRVCSYEEA